MESGTKSSGLLAYVLPILVFVSTLLAFLPSLQNGFVWDDDKNFLQNPNYQGLNWSHLRWMFSTFYAGNYRPLTWITFGFDYTLWGMNPFGYHLTSLLLHGVNSLLFYFITVRLFSLAFSVPVPPADIGLRVAAGLAALVFSVHPLRVEPVAWLSARGHLLAALFFLLTILCVLRVADCVKGNSPRWFWLTAAVTLYALSVLSQPSAIALPLVLLVLDVYPLKRLGSSPGRWFGQRVRGVWWEKVPFLLLGLAAGLIGLLVKQNVPFSIEQLNVPRRLALALYELAFYNWKTIIPVGLSPLYQVPFNFDPWDRPFLVSGLVVLVVCIAVFVARRRWPGGLASWAYYALILVPYVGLLPVIGGALQITADRYSYLACLPWSALSGAGVHFAWQTWFRQRRRCATLILSSTLFVAMVVILMGLTWKQTQVWHDSHSLWKHAVGVTDRSYFNSSVAHYNLGAALASQGKLEEAIVHYSEALRINPNYADARNNLGAALVSQGKLEEAVVHYSEALRIDPNDADAHNNLGAALVSQGKLEEAIVHYSEALRINPKDALAHRNLGVALAQQGKVKEAIAHFSEVLRIAPNAQGYYNLGAALVLDGRTQEAILQLQHALKLNPDYQRARRALADLTSSGAK